MSPGPENPLHLQEVSEAITCASDSAVRLGPVALCREGPTASQCAPARTNGSAVRYPKEGGKGLNATDRATGSPPPHRHRTLLTAASRSAAALNESWFGNGGNNNVAVADPEEEKSHILCAKFTVALRFEPRERAPRVAVSTLGQSLYKHRR